MRLAYTWVQAGVKCSGSGPDWFKFDFEFGLGVGVGVGLGLLQDRTHLDARLFTVRHHIRKGKRSSASFLDSSATLL